MRRSGILLAETAVCSILIEANQVLGTHHQPWDMGTSTLRAYIEHEHVSEEAFHKTKAIGHVQ